MAPLPHFIQAGDAPAAIGKGASSLRCDCGVELVRGYDPRNFLAIDIQCGGCGRITTTPGLPTGALPPAAVMIPERRAEPLPRPADIGAQTALISQEEMQRITALFSPRTPASDRCIVTPDTLEAAAQRYDALTDGRLGTDRDALERLGGDAGARDYPLAWALRRLRDRCEDPEWRCGASDPDSVAITLLAAFMQFDECWSQHPLFPAMAAGAAQGRFSFHALAPFGAAKSLADSGNRVTFTPPPTGGTITGFDLAIGAAERLAVQVTPYQRYEWPRDQGWTLPALSADMQAMLAAAQARINRKHPGMLVVSPGATKSAFDQPLVDAINLALGLLGRRNRGLAAMCVIMPRMLTTERGNEIRFGYSFYPMPNRHYIANQIVMPPGPT